MSNVFIRNLEEIPVRREFLIDRSISPQRYLRILIGPHSLLSKCVEKEAPYTAWESDGQESDKKGLGQGVRDTSELLFSVGQMVTVLRSDVMMIGFREGRKSCVNSLLCCYKMQSGKDVHFEAGNPNICQKAQLRSLWNLI